MPTKIKLYNLSLSELERLAHHDMGHKSKEGLLDYIGYLWWLMKDEDPDFRQELIRDYELYLKSQEREEPVS